MHDTLGQPGIMLTSYGYDRAQRLTTLSNAIGGVTITSHAYTLDSEGNRTALSEYVSGITTGSADSFGMSYDGLKRLAAVTTTNPESFTLDGASNITARTGPSATYAIDGANRPTSDGTNTLTWSAADRLTGRGADTFGYDPLDRLTSSTVSGTARSYAYNGDGLLASVTTGTSTTNLLWDPATSPSRLLASGTSLLVYGLGPLYSVNGTTVTTYARDGVKSIRAEMSGTTVTGSWRYLSYGAIAQSSGSATPAILGYAGQLLDASGLYYMRARWYDPTSGRFLSRDPLAFRSASVAPNGFIYAEAQPTSSWDPTGLMATLDDAEGGDCAYVSSCGSAIRPILDAIHHEGDSVAAATQSGNALIAATGWIEAGAAAVAGGALVMAGSAAIAGATEVAAAGEVLASVFTSAGGLTSSAVATSRVMMRGTDLGDEVVRDALENEGMSLAQTTFRSTQQFLSPNGAWLSQVHFYYDEARQAATTIGMHTILGDRVPWPR